jgi:hypothetical protein
VHDPKGFSGRTWNEKYIRYLSDWVFHTGCIGLVQRRYRNMRMYTLKNLLVRRKISKTMNDQATTKGFEM